MRKGWGEVHRRAGSNSRLKGWKWFCVRSWDVCWTMAATYPHIPLHALLAGPVSHFFSLSGLLKSCPPGSIRVATCPSAAVAMATSPPATFDCAVPSSWQCHTKGWSGVSDSSANWLTTLGQTYSERKVLHAFVSFVFIMSHSAGSCLRVSILACKQVRKLGLRGGERPAGLQPVLLRAWTSLECF